MVGSIKFSLYPTLNRNILPNRALHESYNTKSQLVMAGSANYFIRMVFIYGKPNA